MNKLTDRIRTAREEAGLSQADVAKALRLSRSAVNQWEQGLSKNIRLSHFFALARLLRQDPQWLATGQVFPRAREPVVMSPTPDYPALTSEEKALLHQIRRLPGTSRKKGLLKFLRALGDVAVSPDKSGRLRFCLRSRAIPCRFPPPPSGRGQGEGAFSAFVCCSRTRGISCRHFQGACGRGCAPVERESRRMGTTVS